MLEDSRIQRFLYSIERALCFIIFKLLFRIQFHGADRIPRRGKLIIAGNHVSHLDPIASGLAVRRVDLHFMAKEELLKMPVWRIFLKPLGLILLKRSGQDMNPLKKALKFLSKGQAIGMFPEGTRSADGSLRDPQMGIGYIALKSKAPVVPLYIKGTREILAKGQGKLRPGRIEVFVGDILTFGDRKPIGKEADKKLLYKSISREVMNTIGQLKEKIENNSREI